MAKHILKDIHILKLNILGCDRKIATQEVEEHNKLLHYI